ncbi:MAG: hypothetical protein UZ12_BCD005000198, partial [Bacteroidetes bacterium OLB12]
MSKKKFKEKKAKRDKKERSKPVFFHDSVVGRFEWKN